MLKTSPPPSASDVSNSMGLGLCTSCDELFPCVGILVVNISEESEVEKCHLEIKKERLDEELLLECCAPAYLDRILGAFGEIGSDLIVTLIIFDVASALVNRGVTEFWIMLAALRVRRMLGSAEVIGFVCCTALGFTLSITLGAWRGLVSV